jgi:hypothetical protein
MHVTDVRQISPFAEIVSGLTVLRRSYDVALRQAAAAAKGASAMAARA